MIDFSTKDTLTAKERLAALIDEEPMDRVPFNPCAIGFSAKLYGIDRGEFYRNPEKAFAAGMHLMKTYPWMNCRPSYGWADRGAWEFGGRVVWPDGNRFIAPGSIPLRVLPQKIGDLPDPDPEKAGMNPLVDHFNTLCRKQGFLASLPGGTPTTLSAGIVGRPDFLKWLVRYPDAVHMLQKKVTRFIIRTAETTLKKFGAQNCSVFCGVPMESNQLISAQMFEEFAKPYIREIFSLYRSSGVKNMVVHLCGDHIANLKHWKDIDLAPRTVFSIGHEMDLEKTGMVIGAAHILAGNINNETLHRASPGAVRQEVGRCLSAGMKHPGGFMLMPSCEFPPDTPLENLEAVACALFEEGYMR
ncbi:uroporphyrinogen decarboxylase family protein [Desulfotignum phosphitoxidans]|uniref:Uroporphyrinogen-III decarboxylase n=1 Tax=Desulfotignum phosphitoxidans DSM 13687 TaxID=1286635 RepID=S0G193_9BACT|nr:uroporphyrinogen decarboxylase family protein [Desulfotignum phosphitoxidans]EMS77967.1 uroporphyrinogen-III decarboxylase [Desulfotignum phosphitoxidans DSM 13687]